VRVYEPHVGQQVLSRDNFPGTIKRISVDGTGGITIAVAVESSIRCNDFDASVPNLEFDVPVRFSYTVPTYRACGTVRAYYSERGTSQYVEASDIIGSNVTCHVARHVARSWAHSSRLSIRPARHGAGFRCYYDREGSDVGSVSCFHREKEVDFDAYDSSPFH
jgi:hypothetical protein